MSLRRVAVLAAFAVLVVTAPGAWAEGFVTAPAQVTAHGNVRVAGDVDASERDRLDLRITAPGASPRTVASLPAADATERARSLAFVFDTAACQLPGACSGGVAPNGTYHVQLVAIQAPEVGGQERELATANVVVNVPARAPERVKATRTAPRQVVVSWARGSEPDLLRWEVDDGKLGSKSVPLEQANCQDGTCSVPLSYSEVEGGERTFSVAAVRACGGEGCTPTASARSSAEPISLTDPSPAPSAGGGGASPSPTTAGPQRGQAGATALAERLRGFAPRLELPQLSRPRSGSVTAPQIADTFESTLTYPERVEQVPEPTVAQPRGRAAELITTGGVLDDEQLVRSIAGALILLLAGAHLRAWLARTPGDV